MSVCVVSRQIEKQTNHFLLDLPSLITDQIHSRLWLNPGTSLMRLRWC